MKKYLLSIVFFPIVFGCHETKTPVDVKPLSIADSAPPIKDAMNTIKPGNNMGIGLTGEEMTDDSVFSDGSIPTSWEIAGITDSKEFKLFLKQLQLLVLNDDKEQLARLISYPLGKSIKTEQDFIKNYDRVFTKDAKLSIAKINFSQIFRNSKGAMSEDGKVWFSQQGEEFKIIAINN
ncbi:MAG: hypothetical protein H7Z13_04165 [Ferruginibacter sp.]|nr:hypothetical protein [Ferruginibacter sp.]